MSRMIYVVSTALSKHEAGKVITSSTASWGVGASREQHIGGALEWVKNNKPGFRVDDYIVTEIDVDSIEWPDAE